MGFEVFLKFQSLIFILESAIPDQLPRHEFSGVVRFSTIMICHALFQVSGCACIFLICKMKAADNVNIPHNLLQSVAALSAMPDTASPKSLVLPVAAPRVAPSGRSVVVGSGLNANCSDKLLEAIQRSSKLFDSVMDSSANNQNSLAA